MARLKSAVNCWKISMERTFMGKLKKHSHGLRNMKNKKIITVLLIITIAMGMAVHNITAQKFTNSDTCQYARDNDCDDGGPNSITNLCNYGTDKSDCGERPQVPTIPAEAPTIPAEAPTIPNNDTCQYARDNDCDDGGPNSITNLCNYGTDKSDCGERPQVPTIPAISPTIPAISPTIPAISPTIPAISPTIPAISPTIPAISPTIPNNDTCQYARDNDCDDGGPNSITNLCNYGTDKSDCGER